MVFLSVLRRATGLLLASACFAGLFAQVAGSAEVGTNDFQISQMGPNGDAFTPDIAYSPLHNEYLVVWRADSCEVRAQRIDAATGAEVGVNDFQVGTLCTNNAIAPRVAYNSTNDEYLVLAAGHDMPLGDVVVGQRVNASTGATIGTEFELTNRGPANGNIHYRVYSLALAYNSSANEYLVVWERGIGSSSPANDGRAVYGQRVNAATGAEVGADDFLISYAAGPTANSARSSEPDVAYDSVNNQYLVAWWGDPTSTPSASNHEVRGQRLDAAGTQIGTNAFRISDMGPEGNSNYAALRPRIAYDSVDNQYLVVWEGIDDTPPISNEREIFGQRLNAATGAEIGDNDFLISFSGSFIHSQRPETTYDATRNQYLVVWERAAAGETDIYGQQLAASTGIAVGPDDFRVSDMGPDGDPTYGAGDAAAAWSSTNNQYGIFWSGDDNTPPLVDDEFEIFGQRY